MGIYPFVDGNVEDFEKAFEGLVKANESNSKVILADPDQFALPFFPVADDLVAQGSSKELDGHTDDARELYLRAAAVYRIARFPINRSCQSQKAWAAGKVAYMRASPYMDPPNLEYFIEHKHADISSGDKMEPIPVYVRRPTGRKPAGGWPVLLFICGLDAYRTDHTNRTTAHVAQGFACVSVEIPGTGDCPAAGNDPRSPDRLWSSVLDWVAERADELGFDVNKVVARGVSTGGYYAMRIAHTHASRLLAVVAQGGGSHHMFDTQWINAQNHMEYPFALADAIAYKFGYRSVDDYILDKPREKFSLLNAGILDMDCTRLLLINGMEDSIFPIEDSMLVLRHGRVKDARFLDEKGHMGNPGAEEMIYEWINAVASIGQKSNSI